MIGMTQSILVKSLSMAQSLRWQSTRLRLLGLKGPALKTLHLDDCPPLLFEIPTYENATPLYDWATWLLKMYHNRTCIFPATISAFSYFFMTSFMTRMTHTL